MGIKMQQGLTWHYHSSSGKLSVDVKIHIEHAYGFISHEIERFDKYKINFNSSGDITDPYTETFETFYVIKSGLNTELNVKSEISNNNLNPIQVIASISGASIEGQVIGLTSNESEVVID